MDNFKNINDIRNKQNDLHLYMKQYEENNLKEFGGDLYLDKDSFKEGILDKVSNFTNVLNFYNFIDNIKSNKEKLIICGDYDADGVCSTLLFSDFCDLQGISYEVFIPNRIKDGYGLNETNISNLYDLGLGKDENIKNVICIDNGVNQVGIKNIFDELNINFFIIDHHQEDHELYNSGVDQSIYQINPHLKENLSKILTEESNISSGLLVLMLGVGYLKHMGEEDNIESYIEKSSDLALITTITDMMPVTGINRGLIKNYKDNFLNPNILRSSFQKIFGEALQSNKISYDQEDKSSNDIVRFIGWQLGPIINSFGRISDAIIIYDILKSDTFDLEKLYEMNNYRKDISGKYRKIIEEEKLSELKNNSSYFLYKFNENESFTPGILSILSGTFSNGYNKVVGIGYEKDELIKYSFRSPKGYNLKELFLNSEFSYKGHKEAGVISIGINDKNKLSEFLSSIPIFKNNLIKFTKSNLPIKLTSSLLNIKTINIIDYFGPFGIGNPQPKFIVKGALLKQNTSKNNGYITYTKGGYEKIRLLVGNKKITMYNFGGRFDVQDLFNAKGFLGTLEKPFNEFSSMPVFIINKIIYEKKQ